MTLPVKQLPIEKDQPAHFDIITFDCYGTLIDWETGIYKAFKTALRKAGRPIPPRDELIAIYSEEEGKLEKQPYRLYRQILYEAAVSIAQGQGLDKDNLDPNLLEKSLPEWKPFPDVNPSLERLARHHKLGILSNIDKTLLLSTLKRFTVEFSLVVTAEDVKSYKPQTPHFEAARKANKGLSWLHSAASLYHDIEPATKLGIQTAWINRRNQTVDSNLAARTVVMKDLSELAVWLGD